MTKQKEVKLTIELTPEQSEGYPVSTETLWFKKINEYYELMNIPFFIDELSLGDVVNVNPSKKNTYKLKNIINKSTNSTIWVTFDDETVAESVLQTIYALGCGYEGGVLKGYYTINVPKKVNYQTVLEILDEFESKEELLSFQSSVR